MTTHQPPRLSRDRIRNRRLELGLSERDVAAHSGVSTAVIRSIEAGRVDADLTLGQLAKVGAILGLDLPEVLDTHALPQPAHESPAPGGTDDDVAKVGSLLADIRVLVPVEGLTDALNWDLTRTHAALERLDAALRPAGLRVHRLHHDVRIARTVTTVDPQALEDMWRIHLSRRSLTIAQVRLLKQIRDGVVPLASNKDTQKVRLPELRNAGLIAAAAAESGSTAKWELTDDVRFSLLLGELPTTADVTAPPKPVPAHRTAAGGP
jgi:transcriptional regulator with XRE-family HTH domain